MTPKETRAPKVRAGRHPDAVRIEVRLTDAAAEDLRHAVRKGKHEMVRWCLEKLYLLELDPEAGLPLKRNLVGYRKIVVSDRHWRVIWSVNHDATGTQIVNVAEVIGAGARSDAQVYAEVKARLATMSTDDEVSKVGLAQVLTELGPLLGMEVPPEVLPPVPVPTWLSRTLIFTVGLPAEQVSSMTEPQAQAAWLAYQMGDGS